MKRVLFDHCVPKPLRRQLPECDVTTAFQLGWARLQNGKLLAAAETASFEVLVSSDKNLRHQQNLIGRRIAILELPTNDLQQLLNLTPAITNALAQLTPGAYGQISKDGRIWL